MDSNTAGDDSSPPSIRFIILVVFWVRLGIFAVSTKTSAAVSAVSRVCQHFTTRLRMVPSTLHYHAKVVTWHVNLFTTLLSYRIKVAVLTVWANITDQAFVVRLPDEDPLFIARKSSRTLRTYPLTRSDIHNIYIRGNATLAESHDRQWRPATMVERRLRPTDPAYRRLTKKIINFHSYKLVGPRLTQGMGLVGHGIRVALIEEYGRWPGEPNQLAGHMYSWDLADACYGKIPLSFFDVPGIEVRELVVDTQVAREQQEGEVGTSPGLEVTPSDLESSGGLDFKDWEDLPFSIGDLV